MFFSFLTGSKKQNIPKNSNYFCIMYLVFIFLFGSKIKTILKTLLIDK